MVNKNIIIVLKSSTRFYNIVEHEVVKYYKGYIQITCSYQNKNL